MTNEVELITIGDELLLGFTIDTNAAHLARELAAVGVRVARRATVGDEAADIAAAVREALERTGAVITTGGLGPTSDDLTKPAIAELFGREMQFDDAIWQGLRRLWAGRGWAGEPPEANKLQAMIPRGARVLTNRHGSAPGIWLEDDRGRWVAMLPGVPREMRGMLADELGPLLRERAGPAATVVLSRTLRTTGIGESALAELLGTDVREVAGASLAYNPKWQGTDLRLTIRGLPLEDAGRALDAASAYIYARAARYIYGQGDADLAAVVLGVARERGLHIATAESCTGGLLGARITAIPGSSDVYAGGVVAYANDVKEHLLDVAAETLRAHGAVSEAAAAEMAAGIQSRIGSEIGVGITGVAGPGGGTPEKPVGLVWIAARLRDGQRTHGRVYVGDREEIRLRATQAALEMIRRMIAA